MNYTTLIAEAWAMTWRYRFLWVLGLLAGITGGTMGLGRTSVPEQPSAANLVARAQALIEPNLITIGALTIAALLVVLTVSVLARGGITQATIDLQSGAPSSLLQALGAGRRWFWRFLGMLALLGVLVGVVVGGVALATSNLGVYGALLSAVLLTLGAVVSIVLAYAERAIVVHDLGLIAALRHAWRVFSEHRGTSLLTWTISVLFAGLTAAIVGSMWLTFATATGIVLAVLLAAIVNAFFWSFWTLAYLRLDPTPTA